MKFSPRPYFISPSPSWISVTHTLYAHVAKKNYRGMPFIVNADKTGDWYYGQRICNRVAFELSSSSLFFVFLGQIVRAKKFSNFSVSKRLFYLISSKLLNSLVRFDVCHFYKFGSVRVRKKDGTSTSLIYNCTCLCHLHASMENIVARYIRRAFSPTGNLFSWELRQFILSKDQNLLRKLHNRCACILWISLF